MERKLLLNSSPLSSSEKEMLRALTWHKFGHSFNPSEGFMSTAKVEGFVQCIIQSWNSNPGLCGGYQGKRQKSLLVQRKELEVVLLGFGAV